MDAELIDRDIAEALYTGIIHDTGVFQYSNTTPETLQAAAFLISFGFNFSKIIEESFYQKTYLQSQIMGRALMESIRFMDGRCIVSMVDRKTMDFYNAVPGDLNTLFSSPMLFNRSTISFRPAPWEMVLDTVTTQLPCFF